MLTKIRLIWAVLKGGKKLMQIYVDMYVALIMAKRRNITQVPAHLQEAVLADLNAIGLDGYGNPLPQAPQQ